MDIRDAINLFEANDDIQKKGLDKRDIIQKYRDLIDHETTDPHMREIAKRKLAKLLAAQAAEQTAQAKSDAEREAGRYAPATIGLEVNYDGKPLPKERWGDIYLRGNGKILYFQQVIDRLLPLEPYRIDFRGGTGQFIGDLSGYVWFHPEDEPEVGMVNKALEAKPTIWASASNEGTYYRGGTSRYFLHFNKYQHMFKNKSRR